MIFSSHGRTKGAYPITCMVSVCMYVTGLFMVEGLLRFASKLTYRYLKGFFFPLGSPRGLHDSKKPFLGSLRQMYVVLQFLSDLDEISMAT